MKSRYDLVTAEEMMRGVLLAIVTGTQLLAACADAPAAEVTRSDCGTFVGNTEQNG
jgi:hypothetical protein